MEVAVHTAARVAAEADASEVLVTSTVKELVAGSPFAFTDRGIHELKGVDDWHLFAAPDVTFNQPAVSFVGKSRGEAQVRVRRSRSYLPFRVRTGSAAGGIALPKARGSATNAPRLSIVGFCLGRQVADVLDRLLSREPAPDRQGVNGDAEDGDGEDVPAEREHVAGAVEAE